MVFEDDLDDYEDNVPAPQGFPVTGIASNSAPRHALQLLQGRDGFTSLEEVPFSMGTPLYMTRNQRHIERLVKACFKTGQWKTAEYHGLLSPKDLDAGVDNECANIAILTKDMGAVSRAFREHPIEQPPIEQPPMV